MRHKFFDFISVKPFHLYQNGRDVFLNSVFSLVMKTARENPDFIKIGVTISGKKGQIWAPYTKNDDNYANELQNEFRRLEVSNNISDFITHDLTLEITLAQ